MHHVQLGALLELLHPAAEFLQLRAQPLPPEQQLLLTPALGRLHQLHQPADTQQSQTCTAHQLHHESLLAVAQQNAEGKVLPQQHTVLLYILLPPQELAC